MDHAPTWPEHVDMFFPTATGRHSIARTALGYVLFFQAAVAVVLAGLGALFASTYLFESDHSGMFDGLQVPIGLIICGAGIFAATVLLVTRAHLRRGGAMAGLAVCIVEIVPLYVIHQDGGNLIAYVLRKSNWVALACVVTDLVWRLVSSQRRV